MAFAQSEPYAVLSENNTKLTFYYDDQKESRNGMNVGPFNGSTIATRGWHANSGDIVQVVFDKSFANCTVGSTSHWFYGFTKLESIVNIENLNTSLVHNMDRMFEDCSSLTSLDLSNFETSNVINMNGLFVGCTNLATINISKTKFDTSNVRDMTIMFGSCENLTSIDLSGFNTSKVTSMSCMFNDCYSLTSLDLSSFNTDNVTDMGDMFDDCRSLTSLDLSSFNTANVTNMEDMFSNCRSLTSLDLSSFNTANVTNMRSMFNSCVNLTTIYAGEGWSTSSVTDTNNGQYMFSGCTKLKGGGGTVYNENHVDYTYAHLDGGTNNPGYFTEKVDQPYAILSANNTVLTFYYDYRKNERNGMSIGPFSNRNQTRWNSQQSQQSITNVVFDSSFASCNSITSTAYWFYNLTNLENIEGLDLLNTENVTTMCEMFEDCKKLTSLDVSQFNTANVTDMERMFSGCEKLTSLDVSQFNTEKVENMGAMFASCQSLTSLDVSGFETENVKNMGAMFHTCKKLTSLDVSGFNTANVTDMCAMFNHCEKLTSLDVSGFNTEKVEDMGSMFANCLVLTSLDVSGFDTRNARYMSAMFSGCQSLTSLDVSHFNTEKVGSFFQMFNFCQKLTSLDVSHFNTENVTNMEKMFFLCENLTSIDVSNFNTEKVTTMYQMFWRCSGLTSLDLSSFNTSLVSNMREMFYECTKLSAIYVGPSWSTANTTLSNGMFTRCNVIVGNDGTTYKSNETDKTMAHYGAGGYLRTHVCLTESDGIAPLLIDKWKGKSPFTSFSRSFTQDKASTICLPIAISKTQADAAGSFYEFVGIDKSGSNWEVIMQESNVTDDNPLVANKPYLFKPLATGSVTFCAAVDVPNDADASTFTPSDQTATGEAAVGWTFKGTYEDIAWVSGGSNEADLGSIYGFAANSYEGGNYNVTPGDFVKAASGASVSPFRAYMKYMNPANQSPAMKRSAANQSLPSRLSVRLVARNGSTTAIGVIDNRTGEVFLGDNTPWYTLDGRVLQGQPIAKGIYIHNGRKVVIK
jgi:surface protein